MSTLIIAMIADNLQDQNSARLFSVTIVSIIILILWLFIQWWVSGNLDLDIDDRANIKPEFSNRSKEWKVYKLSIDSEDRFELVKENLIHFIDTNMRGMPVQISEADSVHLWFKVYVNAAEKKIVEEYLDNLVITEIIRGRSAANILTDMEEKRTFIGINGKRGLLKKMG